MAFGLYNSLKSRLFLMFLLYIYIGSFAYRYSKTIYTYYSNSLQVDTIIKLAPVSALIASSCVFQYKFQNTVLKQLLNASIYSELFFPSTCLVKTSLYYVVRPYT